MTPESSVSKSYTSTSQQVRGQQTLYSVMCVCVFSGEECGKVHFLHMHSCYVSPFLIPVLCHFGHSVLWLFLNKLEVTS